MHSKSGTGDAAGRTSAQGSGTTGCSAACSKPDTSEAKVPPFTFSDIERRELSVAIIFLGDLYSTHDHRHHESFLGPWGYPTLHAQFHAQIYVGQLLAPAEMRKTLLEKPSEKIRLKRT